MTILAVLALFAALAMLPAARQQWERQRQLLRLQELAESQASDVERLQAQLKASHEDLEAEREMHRHQLREAVRNERMFRAIQRVQQIIDELAMERHLAFRDDQILEFGDDLVDYEINSTLPIFRPAGRARLFSFCTTLSDILSTRNDDKQLRDLFTLEVRGHTDSIRCPDDPNCNWWVSASRAAHFAALMHDQSLCPGGGALRIEAVGLADSVPSARLTPPRPTRRIELQVVPRYEYLAGSHDG